MSQLDVNAKKSEKIHPALKVGGVAGAVAFAYAVRKIIKNPEYGAYYVAAQDPVAYRHLMDVAAKHASPTQRIAINAEKEAELARMAQFKRAVSHKEWLGKINRENYWSFVRNSFFGQWSKANKALVQLKRARVLTKNPTPRYKRIFKLSRKTKWGLALTTVVLFSVGGKYLGDDEESVISQNRTELGRKIEYLMQHDPDALAKEIYSLDEDAQTIAFSILAENPELFEKVKKQLNEALSEENLKDYDEFERLQQEQLLKEDVTIGDADVSGVTFGGGWGY